MADHILDDAIVPALKPCNAEKLLPGALSEAFEHSVKVSPSLNLGVLRSPSITLQKWIEGQGGRYVIWV